MRKTKIKTADECYDELLSKFQKDKIENKILLQLFNDELCDLMQKYIDVNHKHTAKQLFFDDKNIVEDFNYALNILQRLIKETYKKGVVKEDTILD